jgi:hypothetical protein
MTIKRAKPQTRVNRKNRHRLVRQPHPEVQALTSKESGAAESFSLVTFFLTAKKKVMLSAAIPEKGNEYMYYENCFFLRNKNLKTPTPTTLGNGQSA